jgi:predicted transcriptional regulator
MNSSSRKLYYTITEAAKELGITRAAVHRAVKQGRLEAERGEIIKLVDQNEGLENLRTKPRLLSRLLTPSVGREKNSVTVDNSRQP